METKQNFSLWERYALRRSHPRMMVIGSIAALWSFYFLWMQDLRSTVISTVLGVIAGIIATKRVNIAQMAQTTWGRIALLHLNPWNMSLQLFGLALSLYGLWNHVGTAILSGVSFIFIGHFFGWGEVDQRLKLSQRLPLLIFALFISGMSQVQAGTLEIVGHGIAKRSAEFVSFQISVEAQCYGSSSSAKEAAARFATSVRDALLVYRDESIDDQLIILPGYNYREPLIIHRGGTPKVVCDDQHAWKTSSTLQFKLSKIESLPELQDALVAVIDRESILRTENDLNLPRISASLGNPTPDLSEETQVSMESEALGKAYDDAFRQLKVLASKCNLGSTVLDKVVPYGGAVHTGEMSRGDTIERSTPTPFSFGKLTQHLWRTFIFKSAESMSCQ